MESKFWVASVRPVQATLGALVISLKEPKTSFDQLSNEEGGDFFELVKRAQVLSHMSFAPEKVNLLGLMMVDPFVHFHFLPRYSEERVFKGAKFADRGWPGPPDLAGEPSSDMLLENIKAELRDLI